MLDLAPATEAVGNNQLVAGRDMTVQRGPFSRRFDDIERENWRSMPIPRTSAGLCRSSFLLSSFRHHRLCRSR
jgi:hypothetical protein